MLTWEYTLPAGRDTSGGTLFISDFWCINDISDWVLNNTELPITWKCTRNTCMSYNNVLLLIENCSIDKYMSIITHQDTCYTIVL